MDHSAWILSALVGFLLVWLGSELIRHRLALRQIPIRIHVNGTRGKSSVTRLIAAGLRAAGRRVVAKTTGTTARVILSNAQELAIYRPLGANVREQVRVVRFAAAEKAEVLVIECMALQPTLQWLSEKFFVQATHGVITNTRPDHLDVMGPEETDVARALCGMMPRSAVCFTAERNHRSILQLAAKDRSTELIPIGIEEIDRLTEEEMAGFTYYEHRENVALALKVCDAVGASRQEALRGMQTANPDPGALTFHELDYFGRAITFVNAFAANDPVSSLRIWKLCQERYPEHRSILVFNCRADRAERSRQLGQALREWPRADRVFAVGTGTVFFAQSASRTRDDASALSIVEGDDVHEVFERLLEEARKQTLIVGLGNIGGIGMGLVRLFRNRATLKETPELTPPETVSQEVSQ